MSKRKHSHDLDEVRCTQMDAIQMLLWTMDVLGERATTFQMELGGVLESVIITRCTQLEFDNFIKKVTAQAADAPRGAGRAADAPLT